MGKKEKKHTRVKKKESFFTFIFSKNQRIRLISIIGFYVIVYIIMKYLYPFPDGISDSGGYVLAASMNEYRGFRPFGYSKFLIFLHGISSSVSFVVFTQYLIHVLSTIFFLYTIKYFFRIKNQITESAFDILSIGSILTIYLTNSILSDSLFTSMTLIWLAAGIWFIMSEKLSVKIISFLLKALLLSFIINLRYTGLFYVAIEIVLILMVLLKTNKPLAIGFSFLVIFIAIKTYYRQVERTKDLINIEVFSGFSGWQAANNALHAVPYIDLDTDKIKDSEVKEFSIFAKKVDTMLVQDSYKATASFLWDKKAPLKQYMFYQIKKKNWVYLRAWTYLGKNVYSKFGTHIMTHYPFAFTRHYIIPNLLGTLYPKSDQLFTYFKEDAVTEKQWNDWFELEEGTEIKSRSEIVGEVAKTFPVYRLLLWVLMFTSIIYFLFKKNRKLLSPHQHQTYWLLVVFVMMYFAFHVYSAPFEIRYVAPIHLAQLAIILISFTNLAIRPTEIKE